MSGKPARSRSRRLAGRAMEGDVVAFAALVEIYQGMVCGLAFNSVGSFADAEDIAQDTFLDAYRNLHSLRAPEKFAAWLRGIAINKIGTWLRKRKASREVPVDPGSVQGSALRQRDATDLPEVSLKEKVLRAIETLPENQRLAITLYYMDGRSYSEVADFMDVPVSTVKGRIQGGRKRLKEEMMAMVEGVLEGEKPGREQAVRILRRAVAQAEEAHKARDYQRLLACCDQALGALEQLPPTAKRQKSRIDVLHWQGDAQERLLASTADAITCYQGALEIATEMSDADGQARAVKAILLTRGRAGEFGAMRTAAERGLAIAEAGDNEELLAFCTAARDLCDDPNRKADEGRTGGFVLGHFRVKESSDKWLLEQPRRKDRPSGRANLNVNLNCGTPAYPALLYHVYAPELLMPEKPDTGDEWRQELDTKWLGWPVKNGDVTAESTVEVNDETVEAPAGRFQGCLRLSTALSIAWRKPPSLENEKFVARQVTGTRWMWFAPGVGLVRLLFWNNNDMLTDVVLVEHAPKGRTSEFLPLEPDRWWRYQWLMPGYPGSLMTETWRVAGASDGDITLSCAVHSHQASSDEARRHHALTTRYLQRSTEKKLRAIGALQSAKADPAKLRRAARLGEEVGDAGLQGRALHSLAWYYERKKQPAKALKTWEQMLSALERPEDAQERTALGLDAAGALFRLRRFPRMAEIAAECQKLSRELGLKDRQADWAGLNELARWLGEKGRDEKVSGYLHGQAEVIFTQKGVGAGNRCSGTCAAMRLRKGRPGFAAICLGMGRLLALPVRVGKTWTDNWNTGDGTGCVTPVVKCRIEARKATVETPAGRFGGCVRVRSEIHTTFGAGGAAPDPTWRGYHDGVRLDWYAPGVGLAKVEYRHANGEITRVELAEYKVRAAGESYLPNRVGNTWQYEWHDGGGTLLLREFWRMAARKGKVAYLGFGAVEFK